MAKIVQHRRASTADLAGIAGSLAEFFMDTSKSTLVVMDGATAGGHPLVTETLLSSNLATITSLITTLSSNTWITATSSQLGQVRADGTSIAIDSGLLSLASDYLHAAAINRVSSRVITATGSYTAAANLVYAMVFVTGGGGGGGGADGADTASGAGGGGGPAGGTTMRVYNSTEMGASATITIGAGGNGGGNTGTNGTAGGSTSFVPAGTGFNLSATGGAVSIGFRATTGGVGGSGAGGVGAGGIMNWEGGDGGSGGGADTGEFALGGIGGASFWGGGGTNGAAANAGSSAGQPGTAYGSGGGGAACIDTTTGAAGGAGKAGVVLVVEFISE